MKRGCLALLLATLMVAPAYAQIGQGRLTGVVTDEQGAVLPGVAVVATSPAMIGTQTSLTEADGRYRFPALPSGVYQVTFEISGFQRVQRDNIQIVLGQTISVDIQLRLASLAETVTVTSESPIVDVTTTKVGVSLKDEVLEAIPNSTDVWAALGSAPGVRMQGFDVGGSHKSQQSGYEVFGIQNQSRVVTEGVDHTEGVGGTGFYEDYFATEELSVSGLGSDVEMNSGGASIVSVTKSGGNNFRGLYHISYEPEEFVGDNVDAELADRGYTGNPNLLFWEGHADLGGPIKRDKAWFYYAFNHFKIDKVVSGVPRDIATDIGIFDNHTVKGTYKPGEKNTFIGYFQQGRKQKPQRGLSASLAPESVRAQDSYSRMYKGEWQRMFTNRLFMNVVGGNFTLDWPMAVKVDPAVRPPRIDLATGLVSGAGWDAFTTGRKKPQLKAILNYYLPDKKGSHDFKFGFEYIYDWYRFGINGTSGPIRYRDSAGQAFRIRFADVGPASDFESTWRSSPNTDKHLSFFLQDRWALSNRLNVQAGVRIDYQKVGYQDSTRTPILASIFPGTGNVEGATLVTNANLAPRLGLTYDLTGKGRTVLKAFYGRYYNNLADAFSSANPGGTNYAEYDFNDLNGNLLFDGPQELGALRLRLGGTTTTVDPDLKTQHVDEFSISAEHQFWGESSFRATYVRKISRDWLPYYTAAFVPAWNGALTLPKVAHVGSEVFNLLDVPDGLAALSDQQFTNIPDSNFYYDTIEFAFNKRFGANLFFQSSWDYQWRDELRSADQDPFGLTSPLVADPIQVYYFVNVNPAVSNRQETTVWHGQLFGRYEFPHQIGVAANLRIQSGFNYSRIIPDGGLDDVELNVLPAPFFVEDLKNNRSDNAALLNLRFDKSFAIGRAKVLGALDIYNVLNSNAVTNFFLTNDNFGDVIAALDPRVFMLSARFEF